MGFACAAEPLSTPDITSTGCSHGWEGQRGRELTEMYVKKNQESIRNMSKVVSLFAVLHGSHVALETFCSVLSYRQR